MNKKKNLGLVALAACLAIAVLCLSPPLPAEPARGTGSFDAGANLVNPHTSEDDDTSDDTGDPSGDATPVPDPQPPALAFVTLLAGTGLLRFLKPLAQLGRIAVPVRVPAALIGAAGVVLGRQLGSAGRGGRRSSAARSAWCSP